MVAIVATQFLVPESPVKSPAKIDFAGVAAACGYRHVLRTDATAELQAFLHAPSRGGARFAHMKIRTGTLGDLPRPALAPPAVLDRLMTHIGSAP